MLNKLFHKLKVFRDCKTVLFLSFTLMSFSTLMFALGFASPVSATDVVPSVSVYCSNIDSNSLSNVGANITWYWGDEGDSLTSGLKYSSQNCKTVGNFCRSDTGFCGLEAVTPTPKSGWKFVGWYDKRLTGTQITDSTVLKDLSGFTTSYDFVAHYEEDDSTTTNAASNIVVTVHTNFGSDQSGTYGPLTLTLKDSSGKLIEQQKSETYDFSVHGNNLRRPSVKTTFADKDANGTYQVCVDGTDKCSDVFTNTQDGKSISIELSEDEASKLITGSTQTTTCSISGIGWFVCPVVNFLSGVADSAFNFLEDNFLKIDLETVSSSSDTNTAWGVMRNIANIVFVIAFLVIIISQVTGFGIDNYGVKKLLPRLIVTAILVNMSFLLCQIAVDLSNILGFSLKSLFSNIIPTASWGDSSKADTLTFSTLAGTLLAGSGTVALIGANLSAFIAIVIGAVLALLMIVLILIARKAAIIILIVLAPLAFVAFLLPNTEKLFKSWAKAFGVLLLLFPIISLVYGASNFAASILQNVFNAEGDQWGATVGAAVKTLPLFAVPMILMKALDGLGNVGATINKLRGKASGAISSGITNSSYAKYKEGERNARNAAIGAGTYEGRGGRANPRNWRSSIHEAINGGRFAGKYTTTKAAANLATANKAEAENVAAAAAMMRARYESDPEHAAQHYQDDYETALASGNSFKARAALETLNGAGSGGISKGVESTTRYMQGNLGKGNVDTGLVNKLRSDYGKAGLKSKYAAADKFAFSGDSMEAARGDWRNVGKLGVGELSSQTADSLKDAYKALAKEIDTAEKTGSGPVDYSKLQQQANAVLMPGSAAYGNTSEESRAVLQAIVKGDIAINKKF